MNYIEGHASINGQPVVDKDPRAKFLNANDTLSTDAGKAEVLLTPGVFLRVGDNSEIRMISPSLTDTQIEITRGEAMLEVDDLVKGNHLAIIDHGASITLVKNGLYRFTADVPPTAAVLEGKAQVYVGEKKVELGKGHETVLADNLKTQKFDTKKEDELYAWSNVRSEYEAAASYQAAKSLSASNVNSWWSSGFFGYGPGWFWDPAFSTWGWLPGSGAFYSPFGWGFYSPGVVVYAPVVTTPVWRGGHWNHNGTGSGTTSGSGTTGTGNGNWHQWRSPQNPVTAAVPLNPNRPGAIGSVAASPWANNAARMSTAHTFAATGGLRTASGAPAPVFSANRGGAAMPSSGVAGGGPVGGWSGGSAAHVGSAMGGGGGHVSAAGASRK
ncbi:MAG: hypothetical protein JOY92_04260 [Verrucomicrobia bacterium]|nr:hypothetical protein [Verrucomicrobiota bacterium]